MICSVAKGFPTDKRGVLSSSGRLKSEERTLSPVKINIDQPTKGSPQTLSSKTEMIVCSFVPLYINLLHEGVSLAS